MKIKTLAIAIFAAFLSFFITFSSANAQNERKEYVIEIKDHKFNPTNINVAAGEKFTLVIRNLDKSAEEFESYDLKKEKIVAGGKTIKINVNGLKAGVYKFFGEFNQATAQGTVTVK